jgi:hypothetical protein
VPVSGADIEAQVGAAQGLWTHTPVDWAGNEGAAKPAGWPNNAAQGYLGAGSGTRPSGAVTGTGLPGTVTVLAVSIGSITSTGASVTFTLSGAPTSSRVNYGTTTAVTSNAAGTTATQQTVPISGLTTGTKYYVSVQTTNATGTFVTNLYSFVTA